MVTSISKKYSHTIGGAFAAVLALVSTEASADLLFAATNAIVQTQSPAKTVAAGAFVSLTPKRVVVRFNAECAISGDANNWVNVDIFLNNIKLSPTEQLFGDVNALCGGNHTVAIDGWLSGLSSGLGTAIAGFNTVKVVVFPQVGGTVWWIDDLTLTVEN